MVTFGDLSNKGCIQDRKKDEGQRLKIGIRDQRSEVNNKLSAISDQLSALRGDHAKAQSV